MGVVANIADNHVNHGDLVDGYGQIIDYRHGGTSNSHRHSGNSPPQVGLAAAALGINVLFG